MALSMYATWFKSCVIPFLVLWELGGNLVLSITIINNSPCSSIWSAVPVLFLVNLGKWSDDVITVLIKYNNIIIVMPNFRFSGVADHAMDVIITLLKPKYQEIERGSQRLVLRSIITFSCLVKRLCWELTKMLYMCINWFSFYACRSGCC